MAPSGVIHWSDSPAPWCSAPDGPRHPSRPPGDAAVGRGNVAPVAIGLHLLQVEPVGRAVDENHEASPVGLGALDGEDLVPGTAGSEKQEVRNRK